MIAAGYRKAKIEEENKNKSDREPNFQSRDDILEMSDGLQVEQNMTIDSKDLELRIAQPILGESHSDDSSVLTLSPVASGLTVVRSMDGSITNEPSFEYRDVESHSSIENCPRDDVRFIYRVSSSIEEMNWICSTRGQKEKRTGAAKSDVSTLSGKNYNVIISSHSLPKMVVGGVRAANGVVGGVGGAAGGETEKQINEKWNNGDECLVKKQPTATTAITHHYKETDDITISSSSDDNSFYEPMFRKFGSNKDFSLEVYQMEIEAAVESIKKRAQNCKYRGNEEEKTGDTSGPNKIS